ncbi:MAG: thioesterase family protein [Alcanivoracaceae bacterium]|nr:thioesterase family protein [Alcanivoracaceae bacterium]
MTECLYQRLDNVFNPTAVARSPWHPSLLHGGAVSALFGQVISEQAALQADFTVNRITMNLLRPVPMQALTVSCQWLREGNRLRLLRVDIHADGRLVAQAEAVLQRVLPVQLPDYAPRPAAPPAGPEGLPEFNIQQMLDSKGLEIPTGFHSRVQVRELTPWNEQGATTAWLRVPVHIVSGVPLNPLSQVCMLSDLGNGTGQLNLGAGVGCINADITLALLRYPVSDWICFSSEALLSEQGCGVVHTRLYDSEGAIGHVLQSIQTNGEFSG